MKIAMGSRHTFTTAAGAERHYEVVRTEGPTVNGARATLRNTETAEYAYATHKWLTDPPVPGRGYWSEGR